MNIRAILFLLVFPFLTLANDELKWPFDQTENVAALTTKQVILEKLPVLRVVHYKDDHSWAFVCGTTNDSEDAMIVSMKQIVDTDPSLKSIADLPPGWSADRSTVDAVWIRKKIE